jgi:hypothetical protein
LISLKRKGAVGDVKKKLIGDQPTHPTFGSAFMPDDENESLKDSLETLQSRLINRVENLEFKMR